MNDEMKTELEAITSDVDTVICNLDAAKREAQRSNDNIDLYDGMEDEDEQKINHLQDALADATHDLDSAKDQLRKVVGYLETLVEENEIKQIMKNLI
jgi:outer membrane murein-binding lipoprotein Lpp